MTPQRGWMLMNMTIYRQYDSRWGGKPYPISASSFSGNGCGCVACTHILIEQEKYKSYTPEPVRQYMVSQGFAVAHQGTTWAGIPKTLDHYGFDAKEHATMSDLFTTLNERKKAGKACLGVFLFGAGTRGGVTWTSGGHYVAFTDYKVEGDKHYFYTKDSGARCNDGWHCYETTMKGLIPKVWSADMATTKYKVIDVSEFQKKIDWTKVKADGVVGAIIRFGDGDYNDVRFTENMKGAKAVGLHVGAYIFSRAKTKAEAEREATRLFNACKPYNCDLPLYIDLEADEVRQYAETTANAFLAKMKALGAFAGVYANTSWWNSCLAKVTPPARWVAQYYKECQYKGSYGMWQYSDEGSVKGINGNVDMDWLYVAYWDKGKKGYSGKFPTYRIVKTNAQVIADAIAWLKMVANNNNFHYGHGAKAHKNGCYFCGTQPSSKKSSGIVMPQTTYCCNPFVHAGWAHGGCIPRALKICQGYGSWDFGTGGGSYHTCDLFTKLGDLPTSKLKAGDVLCSDSHVAMYIGNGQVIQAGHEDDNVKNSSSWNSSINIGKWNGYTRVYRYNSSVNADMSIFHGELSDRVKDLYGFLNWYFDGKVGTAQRYYGDKAMSWVKRFQTEQGLVADGIVGSKTIEAMKAVKK